MKDYSKLMDALKDALVEELTSQSEPNQERFMDVLCSTDPWEFTKELLKADDGDVHYLTVAWMHIAKDELRKA